MVKLYKSYGTALRNTHSARIEAVFVDGATEQSEARFAHRASLLQLSTSTVLDEIVATSGPLERHIVLFTLPDGTPGVRHFDVIGEHSATRDERCASTVFTSAAAGAAHMGKLRSGYRADPKWTVLK